MSTSLSLLRRAAVLTAIAVLAYLTIRHLFAVHGALYRSIDVDESEHLHSAWLMDRGLRLYRDFVEDHAPFLIVILKWLVPGNGTTAFPRLDLPTFVVRARLLMSGCGLLTIGALATLAYRVARSVVAPLVAMAAVVGSIFLWYRGLNDIRNDTPTLLLFWLGALFLLGTWSSEKWRFALAGTGIGLVAVAALWNPKWPLESLVLGVVYVVALIQAFRRSMRMTALAIAPPILIVLAAIVSITAVVPFREYLFFTLRYNVLLGDWISKRSSAGVYGFPAMPPYLFCGAAFKGVWPIAAIVITVLIVALPAARRAMTGFDLGAQWILLSLAAAATLEIRFIYPYPNVWSQYYLMWSLVMACLYATTTTAMLRLVPRERTRSSLQIAVAALAAILAERGMPVTADVTQWPMQSYLQRNLRPGETVWISAEAHPIGAPDASYYWFAFNDLVPFSLQYVARHPGGSLLPNVTERDLPICRAERGLQPDLRFVSGGRFLKSLPETRGCLDRMIASGRAVRTLGDEVWDLQPAGTAGGIGGPRLGQHQRHQQPESVSRAETSAEALPTRAGLADSHR